MLFLLKFVLFAIQKNVLMTFIINIENLNSVFIEVFQNDTMIINVIYYKNFETSMHVLKTWMLE